MVSRNRFLRVRENVNRNYHAIFSLKRMLKQLSAYGVKCVKLGKSSTKNVTYSGISWRLDVSGKEGLEASMNECGLTNVCSTTKTALASFGIIARYSGLGGCVRFTTSGHGALLAAETRR